MVEHEKLIRSPICSVVGHVDHGKSSLLDYIRNSKITAEEAGGITQVIGASLVPIDIAVKICKRVYSKIDLIKCPGVLFIDTPGHAAFTNLRTRGGSLADIAILVVDINEGFKPQTLESIKILKTYKTPFIVAANKIDLIKGYTKKAESVVESIDSQSPEVLERFNKLFYSLVGSLYESGFEAERFDKVVDYTKKIAIVPVSAFTGQGVPELLVLLMGLAQRFLSNKLKLNPSEPGKGTLLEVKEDKGLGKTIDVILYDGRLRVGDYIVVGGMNGPIVTKIKSLLLPASLAEIRAKKTRFKPVKEVVAAVGLKIAAPLLEDAIAGTPLYACDGSPAAVDRLKKAVVKEIGQVFIETEKDAVIVKADSLGSLEALINLAKEEGIPIRRAAVGGITKKDLMEAEAIAQNSPEKGVIFGFNVKPLCDVKGFNAKLIVSDVIYKIFEEYKSWEEEILNRKKRELLSSLPSPAKILYLPNHTFRQSNPAIFGVEVLSGTLKAGVKFLTRDGRILGELKSIQQDKDSVASIKKGDRAAIAVNHVTCGRQIHEGDILYVAISGTEFRKLRDLKDYLDEEQIQILREMAPIMHEKGLL